MNWPPASSLGRSLAAAALLRPISPLLSKVRLRIPLDRSAARVLDADLPFSQVRAGRSLAGLCPDLGLVPPLVLHVRPPGGI